MSEPHAPDAVDRYLDRMRHTPLPPLEERTLDAARRAFIESSQRLYPATAAMAAVQATTVRQSGCPGLRVYRDVVAPRVALLYLHGGGFVMGSLDSHDALCRDLAVRAGAVVVAVDYRLAPQHRFPAAQDDARGAMRWLMANCQALGVPQGHIAVMGDSSGGALAATLALEEPRPLLQVLVYPALDLTASSSSHTAYGTGYGLDAETIAFCYAAYVPDPVRRRAVSVAARADLTAAAPAVIAVGEFDPLRDEALRYATRLGAAGVPVTLLRYARMVHGFLSMPKLFADAERALAEISEAIARSVNQAEDLAQTAADRQTNPPSRKADTRRSTPC
jgi:acetyl esterase